MEQVRITIDTGNAAFEDEPASEIARILRKIAEDFESGAQPTLVRDSNGNRVGEVVVFSDYP